MAQYQKVQAEHLKANGIADRIIAEKPDATDEPQEFVRRVASALEYEIIDLMRKPIHRRYGQRLDRYRALGL